MKLDAIDLRILEAIQQNGRITKLALAEKAGLSPTPCWLRLRKLEKAGIVTGYHARVAVRRVAPVASVMMEVAIRASSGSEMMSRTKERSIFRVSMGKRFR